MRPDTAAYTVYEREERRNAEKEVAGDALDWCTVGLQGAQLRGYCQIETGVWSRTITDSRNHGVGLKLQPELL